MRTQTIYWILVIAFASQNVWAGGDIGFQLATNVLTAVNEPMVAEPAAVEIKERVWATAGIEEAISGRERFDCTGFRFRTHRGHVNKPETKPLVEALWPRTREMCDLGECYGSDRETEFTFGGIVLAR